MAASKKTTGAAQSAFRGFNARHSPAIDRFIASFFKGKIRSAQFPFIADCYRDLSAYCLRPGKRLRPLVLIAAYLGYGGDPKRIGEITPIAASLELMHSFLLVQDDVIDRSDVRRGGKALHVVMGERYRGAVNNEHVGNDVALILGDVLFANTIEIISSARIDGDVRTEFMKLFANTYELTAWGQILDIMHSLPADIAPGNGVSTSIGLLKTAYYTVLNPMCMGHVLSGRVRGVAGLVERVPIMQFALPLGMAFQLRDDILGVYGKKKDTGKPSDSDIAEGKLTLFVELAVSSLSDAERKRFISRFSAPRKTAKDIAAIRDVFDRTGVREIATDRLGVLIRQAREALPGCRLREAERKVFDSLVDEVARV